MECSYSRVFRTSTVPEAGMRQKATEAFKVEIDVSQEKKTCAMRKGDGKCCNIKTYQILRMSSLEFTAMTPHLTKGVLLEREGGGMVLEKARIVARQFLESNRPILHCMDQALVLSATSAMVVQYNCAKNALPCQNTVSTEAT